MLHGSQIPLPGAGSVEYGVIRQINLVEQRRVFRRTGALVLDGPGHGVIVSAHCCRLRRDIGDDKIGRRSQQHSDGAGLVVIVVQLIRIIGINVNVKRALVDHVKCVRPGSDEKLS